MTREDDKRRILKGMIDDLNSLQENPEAEPTNFNRELMKYGTREKIESILEGDKIFLRAFEEELDKLPRRSEKLENPVQNTKDWKENFQRVRRKK